MGNSTIGFIDSSGNNWTNEYTYNYVTMGDVRQATAQVNKNASKITIYYEMSVTPSLTSLLGNISPAGVNVNFGSGAVDIFRLKDIAFGGCSNPDAPTDSGLKSYTLSDSELATAIANGFVSISMWSCPGLGTADYHCTAYTAQEIPSSLQNVSVNITVDDPTAKPIAGVPVILETTSGSQFSQTTGSSGVASFANIPLGTYQIKITYNPFADVNQGLTVDGTTDYTVQMQCPSGGQYQLGVCVAGGIPGQIVTALEVAGLVGGGLLVTYGVVKAVPRKEEYIRESLGKAKQYAGSYASRGVGAIKRIPSYIKEKV